MLDLQSFTLPWTTASFFGSAGIVYFSGVRLSYLADAIAMRTGMGHAFIGLVFLAGVTSLPELVTTVYAAWTGNAALALNNIFGGIAMQTAILAIADAIIIQASITAFPRKLTPVLEGVLLIILLSSVLAISTTGDFEVYGYFGVGSVVLGSFYILFIMMLRNFDLRPDWRLIDLPDITAVDDGLKVQNSFYAKPTWLLTIVAIIAALAIIVSGTLLIESAEAIAILSPLGHSFTGVTLLAAATSLPELSTTITAVRIGRYSMAISNIFGSNLIMVFMVLPADMFYFNGAILNEADGTARLALVLGILVTAIYLVGLLVRRKRRIFGMGLDSISVLGIYLFGLFALFLISR